MYNISSGAGELSNLGNNKQDKRPMLVKQKHSIQV